MPSALGVQVPPCAHHKKQPTTKNKLSRNIPNLTIPYPMSQKLNILIATVVLAILAALGYVTHRYHQEYTAKEDYNRIRQDVHITTEKLTSLLGLAKQYPNTKAGNSAKYEAGILHYNQEEYQKAIDILQTYQTTYRITQAHKNYLIASCHSQLDQYKEALPYYQKAITNPTIPLRPFYLQQMAQCHYHLAEKEKALQCLQTICNDHPNYTAIDQVHKQKTQWETKLKQPQS